MTEKKRKEKKKKLSYPKYDYVFRMNGDILLGNNFLNNYLPKQIHYKYIVLTLKMELINISLLEQHKYKIHQALRQQSLDL